MESNLHTFSPLFVSAFLRYVLEREPLECFTETALVLGLAAWDAPIPLTIPVSAVGFLALAYWQSRVEFVEDADNARETIKSKGHHLLPKSAAAGAGGVCPHLASLEAASSSRKRDPSKAISSAPAPVPTDLEVPDADPQAAAWKVPEVNEQGLLGEPMLFQLKLTHLRTKPVEQKYRFAHSYLMAGIPVGWQGSASPLVVVDQPEGPRRRFGPFYRGWFGVRAEDHGRRGGAGLSLADKLREIFDEEGLDHNEFPYAFLITVPSVNGHLNNPLGFWLLYSADKVLTAVIPELNTSFDERRHWIVRREPGHPPHKFVGTFLKDLHVSPFNPIMSKEECAATEGLRQPYKVVVMDPLRSPTNEVYINVCFRWDRTLEDGTVEPERILYGIATPTGPPLVISKATALQRIVFLVRWWWVAMGVTTYGRILTEAGKIYFRYYGTRPRTWARPQLGNKSLGKPARAVEKTLERSFRLLIKSRVESYPGPLAVTYKTPGEHSHRQETFYSPSASSTKAETPLLLQVLTPTFYHRFFHYRDVVEAFTAEMLDPQEFSRTVECSDTDFLLSLFAQGHQQSEQYGGHTLPERPYSSPLGWLQWKLVTSLRPLPNQLNFARMSPPPAFNGPSEMDAFIASSPAVGRVHKGEVHKYRRALLRVFLGERIGSDWEVVGYSRDAVLRTYDALLRAVLLGLAVQTAKSLVVGDGAASLASGLLASGLNVWAAIKAVA